MASSSSSVGWRDNKWLAAGELAIVALIFVADWLHFIPFSKTPFILLLGWLSLRVRRISWHEMGLARYRSWAITFLFGILGGLFIEAFELFVSQPLLVRITGKQPDLADFKILTGNIQLTLLAFALAWTLAAFGEELVYRGYLLNRVADLGNRTRISWICSVIVVSTMFALAHTYQDITGVIEAGIDGFFLAVMYLRTGRNLSVPIIAHGVQDSIDLFLIFLGKYPGLH